MRTILGLILGIHPREVHISEGSARGSGTRSLADCLIAAVAVRHDAALLHKDRDFVFLAAVSPLRLHPRSD